MVTIARAFTGLSVAALIGLATPAMAANVKVTTDTMTTFRATFTGLDTDAASEDGNDFQTWTFNYWTVLVNLRVDGIDAHGNAFGFYEINLTRSGHLLTNPNAQVVKTFLFYANLEEGVVLTDTSVGSAANEPGTDYLSTTVNLSFDGYGQIGSFSGTIAGDADLDGDGTPDDISHTDVVVKNLNGVKAMGIITGKDVGQLIKQTKQPRK